MRVGVGRGFFRMCGIWGGDGDGVYCERGGKGMRFGRWVLVIVAFSCGLCFMNDGFFLVSWIMGSAVWIENWEALWWRFVCFGGW